MNGPDRRDFLKAMLASGGAASALMPSIARALAIPANRRTGTIRDVEHVVILTQENRAFDHYFGTMHGVQGYADRFVLPAPDLGERVDRSIFVQPNEHDGAPHLIAPFRLDTRKDFALFRHDGTPHGFTDGQQAWDNGRMGAWTKSKHNHSLGYFTREDIPFQYALAEAFTLCDAYHCAMHLCTNPNRLYIWTGTHDPLGKGHGPVIDNDYDGFEDPQGHGGYAWTTYPERLMAAGISFQIYQNMADNFGDNSLVGFRRYREARAATDGALAELARRTISTRDLDMLKADVKANKLPQVSWIVAPAALSEHPGPSSPLQGAEYTAQVLDALTANPDVWAKTVLLINFDENDGLFDHVAPPAPPARDPGNPARMLGGTTVPADDEYHTRPKNAEDAAYLHRSYGLGPRVPMYVVSPWSRGGYVASEVFDHTSVIRFLEARFGVPEPNISAWRRAVCGDLTSCFDFAHPNDKPFFGDLPKTRALSDRAGALPRHRPFPPEALTAPVQEEGLRRRCATPYDLDVTLAPGKLVLANNGRAAAAVFHVYDVNDLHADPRRYTVSAGKALDGELPAHRPFDLFILGPSGFHRRLAGRTLAFSARIVAAGAKASVAVRSLSDKPLQVTVQDLAYARPAGTLAVAPGAENGMTFAPADSHGWYDFLVSVDGQIVRLAGHIEDGRESWSDPAAHGAAQLHAETTESMLGRV